MGEALHVEEMTVGKKKITDAESEHESQAMRK